MHKAVINVFLEVVLHTKTWEIKTEAPKEIRGPFQPISPVRKQIGECFPNIANIMHKSTVLRAVVG